MSRQIGGIVSLTMIASLTVPPAIALMVMAGELSLAAGLVGAAMAGLLVYMSTQSLLIVWWGMPGRSEVAPPELVGARLSTAVSCSVIMVLVGYLIEVVASA